MLTTDGRLWIRDATRSEIWFERIFNYDTVFPMNRSGSFLYFLPGCMLFGIVPPAMSIYLTPGESHGSQWVLMATFAIFATVLVGIGVFVRRLDRIHKSRVYLASGEYSRIELRILAKLDSKEHRKRLWQHRHSINHLLLSSGPTDTSEWGLATVERRNEELARREVIKFAVAAILTDMGYDSLSIEWAVSDEFAKLDQLERDRLDKYEVSCHQSIVTANNTIAEKEFRLTELAALRRMLYS